MALDTVLLAVKPGDEGHGAELAQTLVDIAEPADATAKVAQVFTKEQYNNTLKGLGLEDETDVTPEEVAREHGTYRTIVDALDHRV